MRLTASDHARFLAVISAFFFCSCNPFAPGLDSGLGEDEALVTDAKTIEGVFQNVRYAYTFRDTTIYGHLLGSEFVFIYRDYDRGVDVTWGRDEDLRTTYELFRNVQRLDLVWNNIIALSTDSANVSSNVSRNFNLTVTFNPSDILRVEGYANLSLVRTSHQLPWQIARWKDESNF
jgi:hypothetical protein